MSTGKTGDQVMNDWLEKEVAVWREERTIRCPRCGTAFEEGVEGKKLVVLDDWKERV